MIAIESEVSVYEPGQKAIIAWNGLEEILILSTDITAGENTLALEMMPLPSNPKVIEAASFDSFTKIQEFIWTRGPEILGNSYRSGQTESVEVTFHEKIGTHDITVVNASNILGFTEWMEDFLEDNGIDQEIALEDFEAAIKDYMARGFRFFVLDLIDVLTKKNSVEPILYRFETNFLYYPLKISSPIPGDTEITLFLLTEGEIKSQSYSLYYPLSPAYYRSPAKWEPIRFNLTKGELATVDLRLSELFDGKVWLTVLKYSGEVSGLTRDLMITDGNIAASNETDSTGNTIQSMCFGILIGVICTLTGAIFAFLITRPSRTHKPSTESKETAKSQLR